MARDLTKAPIRRSGFRAVARTSLAVVGTTLVFVAGTVAGVAIHLDHPAARRLVSSTLNSALAPVLKGTITLDKIDRIALLSGRVAGMDVTIRDAEGHTVIVARWISARIALVPLLQSLVGTGPLIVRVDRVRVEGADVTLRNDANGVLSLANTFLPRPSSPRVQAASTGQGVVLTVDGLTLDHAWAHGNLGSQPVDIEVDRLSGHLRVDSSELTATLRPLVFRARALPIPAGAVEGSVEGAITFPFATQQRTTAHATVQVRAGELSATARAILYGDAIEVHMEAPRVPARALSAVVVGLPLLAPVSATIDASATPEGASMTGRVDVGESHVELAGSVKRDDGLAAELTAKVVRFSLSESIEGAPPGIVNAEIEVRAAVARSGALRADYDVRTAATEIGGHTVPAIATRGALEPNRLTGEATIDEPGTLTTATYVLAPEVERPAILGLDVDVSTEIPNLLRAPRLAGSVGGAASARVRGHLTLDDGLALDAVVTARATGLRAGAVRASSARVEAGVGGSARSPTVHATAQASDLRAWGLWVSRATVNVDGEALAPRVRLAAETRDGDTLAASASVVLGRITTVRGAEARLGRNREEVRVRVGSVRLGGTDTTFDGVRVFGAGGSLLASVRAGNGALRANIASTALDLGRLGVLVGPSAPALSGMATLNADLVASPTGAHGFVRFAASDVRAGEAVNNAQIDGEAIFDGRAVELRVAASVPEVGAVLIASDGARLGGGMLAESSYRTATGALNAVVVADLARVAAVLPAGTLPVDRLAGKAIMTMRASRLNESMPDVSVGVTTTGLELATEAVDDIAGRSLRGVDFALNGRHDARTGWITLDVFATDARGELAELHAGAKPSLDALVTPTDSLREELLRTPFELEASVPRRELQHLPDAVQWERLRGNVAIELTASGTARDPKAAVAVRASEVAFDTQRSRHAPFDVRLDATFADGRGTSTAGISSDGRDALVARGEGTLHVADLIDGRTGGPRWSAGGDLALSALPLRSLHLLAGRPLGGCVSGTVALRGLHDDAMIDADVHADGLRIGHALIRSAKVKMHAGAGSATFDARFEQDDGELEARGSLGIAWGAALMPSVDDARGVEGTVRAVAFRLAPLQPFVGDSLGKVDGILDADLRYRALPSDPSGAHLEGEASVRDGVVDTALLGQEFRAIEAKLTISRDGTLRLRDASAEGISGRVVVDATAHLDRFALRDAKATVRIAKSEAMSLTYEGVDLGSGWGDVDIKLASEANGATLIDVSVPRFQLELPHEARSSQSLDDEPGVQLGTVTDGGFVSLPRGPPPKPTETPSAERARKPEPTAADVTVRVALGPDVRVYRTNAIDAWLNGNVEAVLQDNRAAVSGAVQVDRGFVELRGRRFTIEHATASFDPARPAADPTITATAAYDAPDATRIFADYVGTAEEGKLRLHSVPALGQSEILSLIVFGTREGAEDSRGGGAAEAAGTASSVGGGVATQGINKALMDITPIDITTRVDTSDSQAPRPEVAVAISSKVSATVWYRIGLPMPGENPDRSMLRLGYRFRPRWLLETSVGDKGTSIVDLIWKLRY